MFQEINQHDAMAPAPVAHDAKDLGGQLTEEYTEA